MKSRLPFALLTSVVVAILFAGCEMPKDGNITHIQFTTSGSVENQKIDQTVVDEFEKANPDIKVNLLCINSRYAEKIQTMMVGDVAPDVFFVNHLQYDDWTRRGMLMDLTQEVQTLSRDATLMPVARKASERDGHYYSIPINCHGWVAYCNFDALKAAGISIPKGGLTWDFLASIAPRLSSRRGDPKAPTSYLMFLPPTPIILWGFGGKLFDDPCHPTRVLANSAETRRALDYIRLMHRTGYALDVYNDQGTVELFRDGKVAFYFSGRWSVPQLEGKTNFAWDVLKIPAGPGGSVTLHGYTGMGVWSKTTQPEAARRFVNFYASKRGAQLLMAGGSTVPVFREMAESPEFRSLRPPESNSRFVETMEEGASSLLLYGAGASEVTEILQGRVQQALASESISTSEITEGLESDLNRWLRKQKQYGTITYQ